MASEEEFLEAEAVAAEESEEEEGGEEPEIDLNAMLLEVMVRRTEILEKLVKGEATSEEVKAMLEAVAMPSPKRRRRR